MERQSSAERTPIKKFTNAKGKVCKTVDLANDETMKKSTADEGAPTPDLFSEIVRFWTKQMVDPDEILIGWGEQELTVSTGDTGLMHHFSVLFNKGPDMHLLNLDVTPPPTTMPKSPCQPRQFFELCKLLIPGFKKPPSSALVILPPKSQVRARLQHFASQISQFTFPLQEGLFQHTPQFIQRLHMVITPGFQRSAEDKGSSLLVFYNITETGRLVQNSEMEEVRLSDMNTVHPMFASSQWTHFLYLVATLAHLHDLFIYFLYDAGHFHQYVVVHEQCFEISQLEEQQPADRTQRLSMQVQSTLEEQDMTIGTAPIWMCDVDAADLAGPQGEAKISSVYPEYRGLKIRLVFRQNYSRWFF